LLSLAEAITFSKRRLRDRTGPVDGARVAPQQSPILRNGYKHCSLGDGLDPSAIVIAWPRARKTRTLQMQPAEARIRLRTLTPASPATEAAAAIAKIFYGRPLTQTIESLPQGERNRCGSVPTPDTQHRISRHLVEQGVGEDVNIHVLGLVDLVSAAAAAVFRMGCIVKAVRREDYDDVAILR